MDAKDEDLNSSHRMNETRDEMNSAEAQQLANNKQRCEIFLKAAAQKIKIFK